MECGNPLFRGEGVRCLSCWRSDVEDFQEMLALGTIGLRVPGVTMPARLTDRAE